MTAYTLLYVDGSDVYDQNYDQEVGRVIDADGTKFKLEKRSFQFFLKGGKLRAVVTEKIRRKKKAFTVTAKESIAADLAFITDDDDGNRTVYAVNESGEVSTAVLADDNADIPLKQLIQYTPLDDSIYFDNYGCGGGPDDGGGDEE